MLRTYNVFYIESLLTRPEYRTVDPHIYFAMLSISVSHKTARHIVIQIVVICQTRHLPRLAHVKQDFVNVVFSKILPFTIFTFSTNPTERERELEWLFLMATTSTEERHFSRYSTL